MKIPWLNDWLARRKLQSMLIKRRKPTKLMSTQEKIALGFIEDCTDCGGKKRIIGVTGTNRSEEAMKKLTDDCDQGLERLECLSLEVDPLENVDVNLDDAVIRVEADIQEVDHRRITNRPDTKGSP